MKRRLPGVDAEWFSNAKGVVSKRGDSRRLGRKPYRLGRMSDDSPRVASVSLRQPWAQVRKPFGLEDHCDVSHHTCTTVEMVLAVVRAAGGDLLGNPPQQVYIEQLVHAVGRFFANPHPQRHCGE